MSLRLRVSCRLVSRGVSGCTAELVLRVGFRVLYCYGGRLSQSMELELEVYARVDLLSLNS